jgi:hypothetical protein
MWIFFKIVLLLVAVPSSAGYALALYVEIASALDHSSHARLGLAMVPAGMILWLLFGRFLRFFHVFEHEVTHLVTGLIFFIQPRQLVASESGGRMEMYGNNFIVSLAPYFVPLFSLVLMALMPLLDSTVSVYACGVLGLVTGIMLLQTCRSSRCSSLTYAVTDLFFLCLCVCGEMSLRWGS